MKINKSKIVNALERTLEAEKTLILATSCENRVTIRPMSHINIGLDVFF